MKALTNKEAVQAIKDGQFVVAIPVFPITSEILIVRYKNTLDIQERNHRYFVKFKALEDVVKEAIFEFYLAEEFFKEENPKILESFLEKEAEIKKNK